MVEVSLVVAQAAICLGNRGETRGTGEDSVEMFDWIIVSCLQVSMVGCENRREYLQYPNLGSLGMLYHYSAAA